MDIKTILKENTHYGHFIVTALLTFLFSYGLLNLSYILGWLCCMGPAAGSSMFTDMTLFWILTIDYVVIIIMLYLLFRYSSKRKQIARLKNYLIIWGVITLAYLILTPKWLIENI